MDTGSSLSVFLESVSGYDLHLELDLGPTVRVATGFRRKRGVWEGFTDAS